MRASFSLADKARGKQRLFKFLYWQYFFTPPGGWGNRRSYDLARFWRALGHEVWILAGGTYFPSRRYRQRAFRTPEGIPIIWLPAPYHQRLPLLRRVWEFIRFSLWSLYIFWRLRRRRLYLIATLPPPTLPLTAVLYRFFTGQRFSIEVYDAWPQVLQTKLPLLLYAPMHFLLRWSFRWADRLFALSPGIAAFLPPQKTILSYNGTRPDLFRRKRIPPFLPFRVIYAGTLGWINGVDFLIEVATILKPYAGIEFWVIGDGSEGERLREQAASLSRVHFFSPVPVEEVPYWLSEAHIGVSLVRNFSILATNSANKFYDYLANGLVVGINYGGWQAEVLRSQRCGFSATSATAFAAGVLRYFWDRSAWEGAAARARLWAEKFYDRRQLATHAIEFLEPILEKNGYYPC